MTMIKKALFLLVFMECSHLFAQNMVVHIDKGENCIIALRDFANITFDDADVTFSKRDGSCRTVNMRSIEYIDFGKYTGIIDLSADKTPIVVEKLSGGLMISGSIGSVINIYDINGRLVLATTLKSSQEFISTANLLQGIYIVQSEGVATKFYKQ